MTFDELLLTVQSLNTEDAFRPRLNREQWKDFGAYLTPQQLRAGELLIRQGSADRQAYLLGQGSLQVYLKGEMAPNGRIAILRPGSLVGEAGLFSQSGRMANVEALTTSTVWGMQLPRFEELVQRKPHIAVEVLRAAASVMAVRMRTNLTQHLPPV